MTACQCRRGYSNVSMVAPWTCSQCQPGTYKTSIGTGACVQCDEYSYNSLYGGDYVGSCLPCPAGSKTGGPGSTSIEYCICVAGYGLDGYCKPCAPGQSSTDTDPYCTNCPINTYSIASKATASSTCVPCPSYAATAKNGSDQASDCGCILGYSGLAGAECKQCQPGTYSDTVGPEPCTL